LGRCVRVSVCSLLAHEGDMGGGHLADAGPERAPDVPAQVRVMR